MTELIRDVAGKRWFPGCLPRESEPGDGKFRIFDPDKAPLARRGPDSLNWEVVKSLIFHIINQGNQGSCCACMGAGIMMLVREIMGLARVIFSQASLYGQGNGGQDQGMAIDRCLQLLVDVGCCPISVIDQYDWRGFRNKTWPVNWKTEAKKYRAAEVMDCPSLEVMQAANEMGHPVAYGAKGHAVIRFFLDINSWGRSWGENGCGIWATDRELIRAIPQYGAWVLLLAADPIGDGDLPQPK